MENTRPGRTRTTAAALVVGLVLVATACSSGGGSDSAPPASGPSSSGPAASASGPARLGLPAGLDAAQRDATLATVRTRAARLGLDARVELTDDAVTISPRPDPYQLEALARRSATQVVAIGDTAIGPCSGPGTASSLPAKRCFQLGDPISTTAPVAGARVSSQTIDGWGVDVNVDPDAWTTWQDAVTPHQGEDVAVVADGEVLGATRLSVMGQQSRLAGQLRRADARRIAAALAIDSDLPAALEAPPLPADPGPDPGDAWMAQLAVDVCGRWLDPAPLFSSEVGLHSHQDGLVYVHSLPEDERGRDLTLGQFAAKGRWDIDADRLRLWDDVDVRNGDECAGRSDTAVRWTVDGVPRAGSPSDLVLAPGQVIVLSFGPEDDPVPAVPALSELLRTTWGPRVP